MCWEIDGQFCICSGSGSTLFSSRHIWESANGSGSVHRAQISSIFYEPLSWRVVTDTIWGGWFGRTAARCRGYIYYVSHLCGIRTADWFTPDTKPGIYRPLGYERVYLPLCQVADTPFHIQGTIYLSATFRHTVQSTDVNSPGDDTLTQCWFDAGPKILDAGQYQAKFSLTSARETLFSPPRAKSPMMTNNSAIDFPAIPGKNNYPCSVMTPHCPVKKTISLYIADCYSTLQIVIGIVRQLFAESPHVRHIRL